MQGPANQATRGEAMDKITVKDGTEIFYKDWARGRPIVFSHGWPLSADDWDGQMLFFLNRGYRVIAHDRPSRPVHADRRGARHGPHATDLAALTTHLDLRMRCMSVTPASAARAVMRLWDRLAMPVPSGIITVAARRDGSDRHAPILQVEMRGQRREIVGIWVHVVPSPVCVTAP